MKRETAAYEHETLVPPEGASDEDLLLFWDHGPDCRVCHPPNTSPTHEKYLNDRKRRAQTVVRVRSDVRVSQAPPLTQHKPVETDDEPTQETSRPRLASSYNEYAERVSNILVAYAVSALGMLLVVMGISHFAGGPSLIEVLDGMMRT